MSAHCAVFYYYPPPQICSERNYVTPKTETETENRFWPFPKPKNRFYRGNPVLETLQLSTARPKIKKNKKLTKSEKPLSIFSSFGLGLGIE